MIASISFTANGSRINKRLHDYFAEAGEVCESVALKRYAEEAGLLPLTVSLKEWCASYFSRADVLIFIGATGIAVRGIAPYVRDKKTDPAVIVIDEQANFVISLLSGHIGGANEMTEKLAGLLGAIPVVTTGTDVNQTFAVDVFARKNGLIIDDMTKAKEAAALLIDKKQVAFTSCQPIKGEIHKKLCKNPAGADLEIAVTVKRDASDKTLRLIPKVLHLGIGCKKNTPVETIEAKVSACMEADGFDWRAVKSVASIDLKKDEAGLIAFCKAHDLPFHVYSSEELKELTGDFTPSRFVGSITGVDNVCERSAVLDAVRAEKDAGKDTEGYEILRRKTAGDGVTVAIAAEKWSVSFE